jgi:beta-glucanase (GH16 family)
MKVGSAGTSLYLRRPSLRTTTLLLVANVLLIAFYSLTGCANFRGIFGTKKVVKTATVSAMPMPAITPTPPAKDHTSQWKLVWGDEFDGPQGAPPDSNKWTAEIGGGGWGNQQLEYDTNNQNAYQDGRGNLVLEAQKDNSARYQCWYGSCQYTSAHISTRGHFSFTYGLLKARIKIPYGQGIWSAFWLLGDNCITVGWPACGEIDVMENISKEPNIIHGTVHGPGYFSGSYRLQDGIFADNFHVFTLQWDPSHLYFFVDGMNYATLDRTNLTNQAYWVYDHPFNIILNLPVGGVWPGSPNSTTIFPQKMYISYIRLYMNR